MNIAQTIAVMFVLLAANPVLASDWPQYLGPDRNAVSDETGLLRSWPADGPEVLWTVPLGEGFGGPAVVGGKVYIYDRVENKTNVLRCLDLATGKEEWTFSYDAPGSIDHNGSRAVPAIDGDKIYVCGPFGNLHCVDMKSHQVVWHKNIWTDFGGGDVPRWAISQNPLVYGNTVIVASQTDNAGLVAYDKLTGDVVWKSAKLSGDAGYVSPVIAKIDGEDHLVMITAKGRGSMGGGRPPAAQGAQGGPPNSAPQSGQGQPGDPAGSAPPAGQGAQMGAPPAAAAAGGSPGAVAGYDPKNGDLLWSYEGFQCNIPCNNVTEVGDNRLFISGGYNAGSALIQIEKAGGAYTAKELFKISEFGTHVHPAVLYKGYLYGNCTTNDVRDGMVCMDLNGNVQWKTKKDPLFNKGGFILVDGMIINNDGEGTFYLIDPSPEGFKVLSKAEILDSKEAWAPLALSNGLLVVRDQKRMKCVVVK